jgi:uncharacterized protein YgiM (DUF1202 family)
MQSPPNPHLAIDRTILIVSVLLLSALVTLAEVAQPDWSELLHIKKPVSTQTTPAETKKTDTATTTPAPVMTPPAAAPAPVATPAPAAPAVKTTTTVSFVHMRQGKSTSTPILFDLDAGTTVILRDDSDSIWQGVTYQGKNGYIYKSYLQY